MSDGEPFDEAADDSREALVRGAFRALCEHGYADLTIERIGDASGRSPSLLYHHYDSKDDLLLAALDRMLDRFEEESPPREFENAHEHLDATVDMVLGEIGDKQGGDGATDDDGAGDDDGADEGTAADRRAGFEIAMLELRMQAPHDPAYRERFTRHDRVMRENLAEVVSDGIEQGVFRDADPGETAALLQTTFAGAQLQRATTYDSGGIPVAELRAAVDELIAERLLADGEPAAGSQPEPERE